LNEWGFLTKDTLIDLRGRNKKSIEEETFVDFSIFVELRLRSNQIKEIKVETFKGLT
jgi:hypothetical protein